MGVYDYLIHDLGDPRTKDVFWVNTPFPVLATILVYLYIVRIWGPKYMKNRPAYNIDWLVSIYNWIQIIWNAYYVYVCMKAFRIGNTTPGFDWFCIPLRSSNEEFSDVIVSGGTVYFYNKIFDLCDTVFFIFRKKMHQVTHLHLYHHIIMVIATWIVVKYHPGGNSYSLVTCNVIVHTVMYLYYELTLMKWNTRPWKKHITQMQIAQFTLVVLHHSILFFRNPCKNTYFVPTIIISQGLYMMYLFITFYIKEYIVKEKKK